MQSDLLCRAPKLGELVETELPYWASQRRYPFMNFQGLISTLASSFHPTGLERLATNLGISVDAAVWLQAAILRHGLNDPLIGSSAQEEGLVIGLVAVSKGVHGLMRRYDEKPWNGRPAEVDTVAWTAQ